MLADAIRNIDSMFWFGVFEYYDASICLLAFQLGQLDVRVCSCAVRVSPFPSSSSSSQSGSSSSSTPHSIFPVTMSSNRTKPDMLSVSEVASLEEMVVLDNALYDHSLREFLLRVSYAERVTNITMLCHHTDDRRREEIQQILNAIRYQNEHHH